MSIASISSDPAQLQELTSVSLKDASSVSLKDYFVEVCKRHAFFVVEIPKLFAEFAFNAHFGGEKVFRGLSVPVKLEYVVFFLDDLKSSTVALIQMPKRVFEVIQGKLSLTGLVTPIRTTTAKVASLVSGFADVQDFFQAIGEAQKAIIGSGRFSAFVARWTYLPSQVGHAGSMIANGNKIYEYATNQLDSQKAIANEKNEKIVALTKNKDYWDTAKYTAIFAISTVFFTAGAVGMLLPAIVPWTASVVILSSRMIAFDRELQIEQVAKSMPSVKQANKIITN